MPVNILMPALSPTMEEGNLARWHVKEGDRVRSGDVIAEIETDKATMEVEAVDEGTVGRIIVPEGAEGVKVNAIIAVLLGEGEDSAAIPLPEPAAPRPAPAPERKAEVTKADAPPATPAPAAARAANRNESSPARIFASPLARRLAKEAGLDLGQLAGSGPHGRIVRSDIEQAKPAGAGKAAPAHDQRPAAPPPSMSDEQVLKLYEPGSYEVVPHDSIRRIIARRLVEAKQTIPHFYLTVDTVIDALLALRADINDAAPQDGDGRPVWKVSVNDMVIKAMAMALQAVPQANATWTETGMLLHRHSDIGVAVAIPGGLITPVVRRAETKRLSEIASEMKDFAARARERKLKPEEYQGGSTAISNLGMYGIRDFAAVINPPHSSILAVGAGEQRPVVRDGKVKVATVMTVTLSTDHRAVDGALGAELIGAFRGFIERPAGMLA
jgi:pyruvate dehydrogenase E2 component (dihydrolipoamide acetyltransferase)